MPTRIKTAAARPAPATTKAPARTPAKGPGRPATMGRPTRASESARWNQAELSADRLFQLKRQELIQQAGMAFRQNGFHETSMEDVARALGVTKAALYRYVADKHELLFECHKIAMDLGDAAVEYGLQHGTDGNSRTQLTLRRFVESYIGANSAGAAIVNIDALTKEHRAEIVRRRDRFDRALRKFIQEGIDDGSIEPCDPRIVTFAIMGAINWLPRWYQPDGALSGAEVTDRILDFFAKGLVKR